MNNDNQNLENLPTQTEVGNWLDWLRSIELPDSIKENALIAIAKGVGSLITTTLDVPVAYLEGLAQDLRKRTEARGLIIENASKSISVLVQNDPKIAGRALSNFGEKILAQQSNSENTAKKAIDELQSRNYSSDAKATIDDDWLTLFWRLAALKSNEEIQTILGKLLANEITEPGTVSPYTIQILSVLTGALAKSFERICNISIDDGTSAYVIHPNVFAFQNIGPLDKYHVTYDDLFDLDDVGLIRSAETLMINYAEDANADYEVIDFGGKKAKIKLNGHQVNLIQFTKAGRELRNLIVLERVSEYTAILEEKLGSDFIPNVT